MRELMFIWTGWVFGGNDYEVNTGSRLCEGIEGGGGGGGAGHSVKQADGWPDSMLIMATLVYWEATLCSRSMGADEWRHITSCVLCPDMRIPFKDGEVFSVTFAVYTRLSYQYSYLKTKVIWVTKEVYNKPSNVSYLFWFLFYVQYPCGIQICAYSSVISCGKMCLWQLLSSSTTEGWCVIYCLDLCFKL